MLLPILVSAQQITNKFELNKDGKVLVSASSSNVQIEYWDQNYVEVKASIVGDYSEEQKKEMLKAWGVQTKGDKEVVIVTAGASQWKGERLNNFVWIEDGKEYEIITPDVVVPPVSPIPPAPPIPSTSELPPIPPSIVDIHVNIPKIPELEKMPTWPFNDDDDISVRIGDDVMKGSHSSYSVDFDKIAYEKNKKEYLAKLNKKFGTNVTQKEVDRWLEELAQWMDSIERKMDAWGEEFGAHMETEFGPEFEGKMEAWGEKFGKEFGEKMEAWEDKYGKDIEKWAKQFEEEFEPQMKELGKHIEENLAPQIEKLVEEITKSIADKDFVIKDSIARFEVRRAELTERLVNRAKEMKERAQERRENAKERAEELREAADLRREEIHVRRINDRNSVWAYRTNTLDSKDKQLIVRVPQNAQVELDVRYGSTELVGAQNIQAHLNYTDLKADTISGDETQIDVSQSDVNIKNWEAGNLSLNFVNDCTIANAKSIALESNTSDVIIGSIEENAWLNGSFGNLKIIQVGSQFKSIELTLENTDAKLSMPNSAYDLYYRGIHSNWIPTKELTVDKTQMGNQEIIKGYHKSNSSKRSVHINARYSDLILE
jgi:hypothetical protein